MKQKKIFLKNIIQEKMENKMKSVLMLMFVALSVQNVYADAATATATQAGSAFGGLMPLLIIFIFFYLFLIRPQQKQRKEHEKMLNDLKKDDKIITSGGLYATVVSVNADIVEAKISDSTRVKIVKSTIVKVVNKEEVITPEIIKK